MNPTHLFLVPFVLQGGAMIIDEFHFHRKRRLPMWERLGHPLDTLTVLASFGFLLWAAPTTTNLAIYLGLAGFSCLFVTKDEPVHAELCGAGESWLHSLLFILHPLVFIVTGLIWYSENWTNDYFSLTSLKPILLGQTLITLAFLVYQFVYWNIYDKNTDHR